MVNRWPYHPKFEKDELLTSWIKRVSEGYLDEIPSILDRESLRGLHIDGIDENPLSELVGHLSRSSGIGSIIFRRHTLQHWDKHFPVLKAGRKKKRRRGIEGVKKLHRDHFILKHKIIRISKNGIRFCPICLQEGIPYIRFYWKLGYYLVCHRHQIAMHNLCPHCNSPVFLLTQNTKLGNCSSCHGRLSEAPIIKILEPHCSLIHKAFYDQISDIKAIEAQNFLGFYWNAYRLLSGQDENYLDKLEGKLDISCVVPNSHSLFHEYRISLLAYHSLKARPLYLLDVLHCVVCDFRTDTTSKLSKHEKYHLGPRLECKVCFEKFVEQFELKRHKEVHKPEMVLCEFCNAPFSSEARYSAHLHKQYSHELQQRILSAIQSLKENGEKLTYVHIAKKSRLPRSIFNNHPEYKELMELENDLRTRYFAVSKMDYADKLIEYNEIVMEAINRLQIKGENISQSQIAKEIGVSRNFFYSYPELKKKVEENRTKPVVIDDDELKLIVERTIVDLDKLEKSITIKAVAEYIDRDPETLSKRPKIRDLIMTNWKIYRNGKIIRQIEIKEVKNVVLQLKSTGTSVSKSKISKKLKITVENLNRNCGIKEYVEMEIDRYKKDQIERFTIRLITVLAEFQQSSKEITFRKIAKTMGVDVHKLLDNEKYRKIVEIKKVDFEKRKQSNYIPRKFRGKAFRIKKVNNRVKSTL